MSTICLNKPFVAFEPPRVEENLGLAAKFVLHNFGRKKGRFLIPKGGNPHQRGVPVEDTEEFSIACEALLRAVEKYDPSSGYKFSTYATWCMKNAFISLNRKRRVPLELVDQRVMESIVEKENCTSEIDEIDEILETQEEKGPDKLDKKMMLEYYLGQKTLEEIGRMYGVTKARAQQRIARAIVKIQKRLKGNV